jgi:hypothetical protein
MFPWLQKAVQHEITMGKIHERLDDKLVEFIGKQHLFFVGTAPDSPGEPGWDGLIARFPEYPGVRSVIVVDVERISDSCGYAVPLYEYQGERSQLIAYANEKGPEGMEEYKAKKNRASIVGLAGLRSASGDGR